MLNSRQRKTLTVVLCIGIVLAALIAISFAVPIYGDICEQSEQTGAKECAPYHLVTYALWHLLKGLDAAGAGITALATLAIAWFTWTLRRSTDRLWEAGERQIGVAQQAANTAKMAAEAAIGAERAWLFLVIDEDNVEEALEAATVEDPSEVPIENRRPFVKFHFENHGKTPAIVKEVSTALLYELKFPKGAEAFAERPWTDECVVAAGMRYPTGRDDDGSPWKLRRSGGRITKDEADEPNFFWFFGHITYDDVWGNEHVTYFSWKHDGYLSWQISSEGEGGNRRT